MNREPKQKIKTIKKNQMEILELKKYVYEIKTALTGQIEMAEESQN